MHGGLLRLIAYFDEVWWVYIAHIAVTVKQHIAGLSRYFSSEGHAILSGSARLLECNCTRVIEPASRMLTPPRRPGHSIASIRQGPGLRMASLKRAANSALLRA